MPLRFTAPEFRQRGKNPADHLVESFPTGQIEVILGVTLLKYCGVVIDNPVLEGATLSLPPIVPAGEGWAFSCRTLLYQDFSWTIEIPPNPPWISTTQPDLEFAGLSGDFHTAAPHAYFKVEKSGVKNQIVAADPGSGVSSSSSRRASTGTKRMPWWGAARRTSTIKAWTCPAGDGEPNGERRLGS